MLTIYLDDVLSSSRTAHDIAAVVWLHKHIPWSGPLNVAYHLPGRAPLSSSQSGVIASRDALLALRSSVVRNRLACGRHEQSSGTGFTMLFPPRRIACEAQRGQGYCTLETALSQGMRSDSSRSRRVEQFTAWFKVR
jgi:hypothetical protein